MEFLKKSEGKEVVNLDNTQYVLEMDHITKEYSGNQVLKGVNLHIKPGEIHALMGENGAGKSTLMNILFGMPVIHSTGGFGGSVKMAGQPVNIDTPLKAMELGIGMVHQEFMLIPGFTVTENIKIGREISTPNLVSRVFGTTYWYLTAVELVGFAGMTAGGLIMGTWGGFSRRGKTLALGLAAFGTLSMGMGLTQHFFIYLILMTLYGIAMTTVQTSVTTIIQEQAEGAVHGRVFGLMGSLYSGALPLGMAIFGPLADVFPIQSLMVVSGISLLLTALAARSIST